MALKHAYNKTVKFLGVLDILGCPSYVHGAVPDSQANHHSQWLLHRKRLVETFHIVTLAAEVNDYHGRLMKSSEIQL